MNILAIGAHGDDLEMFCGGTLARCAARGDQVFMCVVTDGRGRPAGDPDHIAALRRAESEASARVIGAQSFNLGIPDGGLWFEDSARHKFIEVIRQTRPDIIITHPPEDYHPDHKTTSRLVMDAAQVARTANYPSEYPPHRVIVPIAFMDSERGVGFTPQDYVDISEVFDLKLQMLEQHRTQFMPGVYDPDYVMPKRGDHLFYRYAEVMSGFRGLQADVRYAEAFAYWHVANRIVTRRLLP